MSALSPAERERFTKLAEELSETGQATCKLLLHGRVSEFEGTMYQNVTDVEREVGDIYAALDVLITSGDLDPRNIQKFRIDKLRKITRIFNEQPLSLKTTLDNLAASLELLDASSDV